MNKKIKSLNCIGDTERFLVYLSIWKKSHVEGKCQRDVDMVVEDIVRQIEYLNHLDKVGEARLILNKLLNLIDLDIPHIREMIVDAYIMLDDFDYFYDWYEQNLFRRKANEGDQIIIYALLCHNRNKEALRVFDKIFPALSQIGHFTFALRQIPKLIGSKIQRRTYYQSLLKRCENIISNQNSQYININIWYETLLQVQYCLCDLSGFERTAKTLAEINQDMAKPHLDLLDRLQSRKNPKWKKNKVFGIGLSKTGTYSLSKAFTSLGFSTAHWTNPYSYDLLTLEDIPLFDTLTDITISYQFKEIFKVYPDARFVLTSRSIDKWKESFITHYKRSMNVTGFEELRETINNQHPPRFGQSYIDIHQVLYFQYNDLSEAYMAHERDVLSFFKGKENQLLVLDVSQPNAFKDLALFLEVDPPQNDFPHENTKEEKAKWVAPISGATRGFNFQT